MIGRRGFIGALLGAAVLDPERLLWVPGKKMISIPAPTSTIYPVFVYYVENGYFLGSSTPPHKWITDTYAASGWDAKVETVKTKELEVHANHSFRLVPYMMETLKVTLTQQYDPHLTHLTGGSLHVYKRVPQVNGKLISG